MTVFGLPEEMQIKAREKTGLSDAASADLAIRETLRFLYLSAHADRPLFFTGDETVDRVWHFFITETEFYANLCDRIRPGCFVHHRGIPYSEYCAQKTPKELLEEHFSWLASYVRSFGEIEPDAILFLPLAQNLMERLGSTLPELNALAKRLVPGSQSHPARTFCLEEVLNALRLRQVELDQDSVLLFATVREMLQGVRAASGREITNDELIQVFSVSTALGFALWQHLAAMERIGNSSRWREQNPARFAEFEKGLRTIGLATTHLAKPEGSPLRGERIEGGYRVNGAVPWCSGYAAFDEVVIGFDAGDSLVFALSPMPDGSEAFGSWEASPMRLGALNSTRTFSAKIKDLIVSDRDVISIRKKSDPVPGTASRYRMPEIGMASGAIEEIRRMILRDPTGEPVRIAMDRLEQKISRLLALIREDSRPLSDADHLQKADLIRDATRLLVIASGGAALLQGSPAARRSLEALLVDVVIQPVSVLKRKIEASGS